MSDMPSVGQQLDAATETRAAVPGYPEAGPYPATIGDVADEVLSWVKAREDDRSAAGLSGALSSRLLTAADPTLPTSFDVDGRGGPVWSGEGWTVWAEDDEVHVSVVDDSHPGAGGPQYVFEAEIVDAIAAARLKLPATRHGMVPGSHERPDGPECTCGRSWSRFDDACVAGGAS